MFQKEVVQLEVCTNQANSLSRQQDHQPLPKQTSYKAGQIVGRYLLEMKHEADEMERNKTGVCQAYKSHSFDIRRDVRWEELQYSPISVWEASALAVFVLPFDGPGGAPLHFDPADKPRQGRRSKSCA